MTGFALAKLDEIDQLDDGRTPLTPVRHRLGITAFGVNAWIARAAGDRMIPEHDQANDDEELYLVHRGRATFELDGKRVDAQAGTLVYVKPRVTRTAFAEEAGTTILAIGATPGEAFETAGWEIWFPFRHLYETGKYAEIADRGRELIDTDPQYAEPVYNLACAEALAGRPADAIEHLRHAIELHEPLRELARTDSDLDPIRTEPGFRELVGAGDPLD